jgi:hypothetical protein
MLNRQDRRRVKVMRDFYGYNEPRNWSWLKLPARALRALLEWGR